MNQDVQNYLPLRIVHISREATKGVYAAPDIHYQPLTLLSLSLKQTSSKFRISGANAIMDVDSDVFSHFLAMPFMRRWNVERIGPRAQVYNIQMMCHLVWTFCTFAWFLSLANVRLYFAHFKHGRSSGICIIAFTCVFNTQIYIRTSLLQLYLRYIYLKSSL